MGLVYINFKSCDHSFGQTYFDFSNIFCVMKTFTMKGKHSVILEVPKSRITCLEVGKETLDLDL